MQNVTATIKRLKREGKKTNEIISTLNAEGLTTPRGKEWNASSFHFWRQKKFAFGTQDETAHTKCATRPIVLKVDPEKDDLLRTILRLDIDAETKVKVLNKLV